MVEADAATKKEKPSETASLKEYETVVGQFRALTDIRFKLLGLLPLGTIGTMIALKDNTEVNPLVGFFGVIITVALFVYHLRNDQLYNELVSRAGQIERELGLYEGSFTQRPHPSHALGAGLQIEHGWPVRLVYVGSAALWLSFALYPFARGVALKATWAEPYQSKATMAPTCTYVTSPTSPPSRGEDSAGGPAKAVTSAGNVQPASTPALGLLQQVLVTVTLLSLSALFAWGALRILKRSQKESALRMRRAVDAAMDILEQLPLGSVDPAELQDVAKVVRRELEENPARETVYFQRLSFYLDPRYTERYLGRPVGKDAVGPEFAARLLAQTIDQPARWIFDVHTKRRGE
ncbi:MAG TPA: hypothetical protein VHL80_05680 [Polyangia bacterium]|nr:hypothetical protein [Polyangia bacterium]